MHKGKKKKKIDVTLVVLTQKKKNKNFELKLQQKAISGCSLVHGETSVKAFLIYMLVSNSFAL